MSRRDVWIVSPLRSPVTKAFRGGLRNKRPDDLCADVIRAVLAKTPTLDPRDIEDVYVGCAMPEAEQGMNVARFALLLAGLPDTVPGVTINRFCSSGVQTIAMAADAVAAGSADCILAGGTESMSMVPMMGNRVVGSRSVMDKHPEFYLGMGLTAENVADEYGVRREDQDEFALLSHTRAVAALKSGHFRDETVSVATQQRTLGTHGETVVTPVSVDADDGPRADTSREALGKLRAAFRQGGSVTAGNSSQMSDGAAMCLVVSEEFGKRHNLKPLARFVAYSVAGVPPRVMGIGPVEAIPRVLKRGGVALKDIDRVELNEAFAAQSLAVMRKLELDPTKVNPSGGAIALGHPLGATGAKLTATLCHAMHREGGRYGLVTMCIGTGMGAAALFERL